MPCLPTLCQSLTGSLAALALAGGAQAQPLQWHGWTFTGATTAYAQWDALGTVDIAVLGDTAGGGGHQIAFAQGPDAGVVLPAYAASHLGINGPWSVRLDFSGLASTQGVVVAVGNFGHSLAGYPGYGFAATDTAGHAMGDGAFTAVAHWDHRWIQPDYPLLFDDDAALANGRFEVTPVPGNSEHDSDLLLLRLPAGVARIEVFALGPMGGDTVNVMLASPVPEPAPWVLLAGGLAAWCLRHAQRRPRLAPTAAARQA